MHQTGGLIRLAGRAGGRESEQEDAVPYPVFAGEPVVADAASGNSDVKPESNVSRAGAVALVVIPFDPLGLCANSQRDDIYTNGKNYLQIMEMSVDLYIYLNAGKITASRRLPCSIRSWAP